MKNTTHLNTMMMVEHTPEYTQDSFKLTQNMLDMTEHTLDPEERRCDKERPHVKNIDADMNESNIIESHTRFC